MNRSDIVLKLSELMGISSKKAYDVVKTIFTEIEEALLRGERVEVRGFGSFKVKSYEGYKGRNPSTGAIIEVPPKRLPVFKVGKELKKRVDVF